MKKIKITITGRPLVMDYCNTDKDFDSEYYTVVGWDSLEELHVNDGEDNLIKKKGKYATTDKYFHELFSDEGDHPLPVDIRTVSLPTEVFTYWVEIPDNEEFDLKKLQLIKSSYEVERFPYFIPADCILYAGKPFETNISADLGTGGHDYDEDTIWEFM